MLMHPGENRWQEASNLQVDWPTWTPDSSAVLCKSGDLVLRYNLDSGKFETVTSVKGEETGGYLKWLGISFSGVPLRTLNRDSRQIYSLQFEPR
jgi:hypothetical protein